MPTPLPQSITATPVTSYMEGRAMRMAYENDKLQQQILQAQVDAIPAEMESRRQLAAYEAQLRIMEMQRLMAPPNTEVQSFSNGRVIEKRPGYYDYETGQNVPSSVRQLRDPDPEVVSGGGGDGDKWQQGPVTSKGNATSYNPRTNTYMVHEDIETIRSPEAVGAVTGARVGTTLNWNTKKAISDAAYSIENVRNKLLYLKQKFAGAKKTGITAQFRAAIDTDLQELQSLINLHVLGIMQGAKAEGVSFGQMTWPEWELLGKAGYSLKNTPEANERIIDNFLNQLDAQTGELRRRAESDQPAISYPWDRNPSGGGTRKTDMSRFED